MLAIPRNYRLPPRCEQVASKMSASVKGALHLQLALIIIKTICRGVCVCVGGGGGGGGGGCC